MCHTEKLKKMCNEYFSPVSKGIEPSKYFTNQSLTVPLNC